METWTPILVDRVITALESIDASLKVLVSAHQKTAPRLTATGSQLTGKYGDPLVRFMPRFWTGENFKGHHFSECPPELLDLLAESLDWVADKAEQKNEMTDGDTPKPVAPYRRADAAKARGWAAKLRANGGKAPTQPKLPVPDWAKGPPEKLGDWSKSDGGPTF